ncbi:uncharacterized protein LOC110843852 isoform X2 [Folsomia candida]|uniref:uncharacterized protein LOC110843852 isoform X2 n=1 Tax=Folsomia candida TaxID=158441 RepID=UPI001605079C|nr:uncharacterized protein LOC110843852 isoform X2 [Folsomia candida]
MSSAFSQRCLICSSWSPKSTSTSFLSGEESDESRVSCMLDRQVSALYLVSGLLEVPGEMCARFLTVYGHPDEWANVCEWCNILVAQGMTLFRQIRRLEAEHAKVRAAVKDRMKVKVEVEGSGNDQEAAAIDIRRFLDAIDNLEAEHKSETQCNQQDIKNYIGSQAVATVNETPHKRSSKGSTPRRTAKVTKSRLKPMVQPSKPCPDSSSENIMFPSPSKSDGSPHQGIISDTKGRATAKLKKKPKGITKSYVKPKGLYLSEDADTLSSSHGVRRSGRQVTKKVQFDNDIKNEDHQNMLEDTNVQHNIMEEQKDFDLGAEERDSDPDWESEDLSYSFQKHTAKSEQSIKFNSELERDIICNDNSSSNNSEDNSHELNDAPSSSNKNKLAESRKKYGYTSNKLMDNGRLKPEFRKFPIRETLTFQQVIELQKKTALPPVLGRITKEERQERRLLQKGNSLAALCRRHRVKEFPCSTCGHVFSMYKDWNIHANINECEKSNNTLRKFGPVVIERMKCEQCGKPVGSATALEDHHRTAHDGSDLILNCRGCSVVFRQSPTRIPIVLSLPYNVHIKKDVGKPFEIAMRLFDFIYEFDTLIQYPGHTFVFNATNHFLPNIY